MTSPDLFDPQRPSVFTLPASAGFLDALARTLNRAFPDPDAVAGLTVLVPTRRAGRALAEAFARTRETGAGVALLPAIRPIGDVDADEPPFEPGELADIAPPAVDPARRRFELASLILKRESASRRSMGVGAALALADDLAGLIDDMATEEIADLSRLDETVRSVLPAHMQEAAMFLDIVMAAWPARLDELGVTDPAARRSALLKALARRWRDHPPEAPVIAAGSTGSIPAASELLVAVANLPRGAVILPGLDHEMDQAGWDAIDDSHPQRSMKSLLDQMGLGRSDVRLWPGVATGRQAAARARVMGEALRAAEATSDWVSRVDDLRQGWGERVFEDAFDGLSIVEAGNESEEARAISLMLRETLETPGRTAIVVTPDRALARRIATEMRRYGVPLDDSAGEALSDTASGAFLMRILDVALDRGSALALAALFSSPLFTLGRERATLRPQLGLIERRALRGRRPGENFSDVRQRVAEAFPEDATGRPSPQSLLGAVEDALTPLLELSRDQPAARWAEALVRAGEALSADEIRSGADRLWAGEAGESAAQLMREFLREAEILPEMGLRDFSRALLETARTRRVRPRFGTHPRLALLGPLEARLVSADRVILAGLNEGGWPPRAKVDPFMSRGMRAAVGLSAPERRFGLAAHDFAQLAMGSDVILTRSRRVDGAPAVASRWLWRLQTLARGALGKEAERALAPGIDYCGFARRTDTPSRELGTAIRPPEPAPPVEARPRQLSVTRIETWIRDPYSIYARYILGLKQLDPLDRPAGPPERGTAYHDALHRWTQTLPDSEVLPGDAMERLVETGREALLAAGFSEAELGLELPRFARVARFITEWETDRREMEIRPVALECEGSLTFESLAGPFTLTARADRIDMNQTGALEIIDFKTGRIPGKKEVEVGFAPQLPLEAAIAAHGGFADAPSHESEDLLYVRISGGREPGMEASAVGKTEAIELAETALSRLQDWVAKFDDPARTYPSQPRAKYTHDYGEYDHLARRKEWASAPEAGDEGAGG
jgi:ATP-dependent helicase/nuclease subunit B